MTDCSLRQATITNAAGNGTSVTFTADHTFGVGQIVNIDNMDSSNYNMKAARITSVTATTFTVLSPITDAFNSGGTATDTHSYYSIDADINLAAGTESWNLVQEATITNAVGDGSSVVYTAANNFTVGQDIIIEGIEPMAYSVGRATITAADANSFTVSSSVTDAYVSGGKAYSNGWQPITGRNGQFEHATVLGNDHTISNLTIHRNANRIGLFSYTKYVKVQELNLTGIMVSSAGDLLPEETGGIVGRSDNSSFEDISVSGTVYGRYNAGLLGGRVFSELSNIQASGTVAGRTTNVQDNRWSYFGSRLGGVAGSYYGAAVNVTADVDVDGLLRTGVAGQPVGPGVDIGGVFGSVDGAFRNITASGDIWGTVQAGGVFGENC
jgi:hypothetical protein